MIVDSIDLSYFLVIIGALTFSTNIITEVIKKLISGFPAQLIAFIVAMFITIASFFAFADIANIQIEWYMVAGSVAAGFFVSYAAQFGFDKFKEVAEKFKEGRNVYK